LLGEHPRWLAYELPPEARSGKTGRGQVQRWFVVRLRDGSPRLDIGQPAPGSANPEFAAFRWTSVSDVVESAVEFRRPVYDEVAAFLHSLGVA